MNISHYIGIDPGRNTGIAVWNGNKIVDTATGAIWDAFNYINTYWAEYHPNVLVVVEDPNKNRPVFPRGVNDAMKSKIAQNVGMNKRDAQLIIEYCERKDVPVRQVRPTSSKWSAKKLELITGIKGRTNEHVRDAIKLVYGL